MSGKIKIQHYVPEFYLRYFTIGGKGNRLHCFDKSTLARFTVNIRNIASESYFYDTAGDIDQHEEKRLSYLESISKVTCDSVLKAEDLNPLPSRVVLALFIATQQLRTKSHRRKIQGSLRRMGEKMHRVKLLREEQQPEVFESHLLELEEIINSEERMKFMHVDTLKNVRQVAQDILMMRWVLLVNLTSLPYWCSDNPVSRYHHIRKEIWPWGSPNSKFGRIEAYFPLSPRISLCLCKETLDDSLPSKYEVLEVRHILFQNYLQLYGSTRYVFSDRDSFDSAEEMTKYKEGFLLGWPS